MKTVKALVLFAVVAVAVVLASGQSSAPRALITQPIDDSKLVRLPGNTHPLARPEFDRGAAAASLPYERMMLVLKTAPERGYALDDLLAQQQDRSSPNYHKWLSPEEFGARFGASDADIQTIKAWLASHGFSIDTVAKGRNLIEFSGTAAQVQDAFHTAIHRYEINGESHWANETDPSIPAALAPAVVGVASLNNFPRKPAHRLVSGSARNQVAAKMAAPKIKKAAAGKNPQYSYACTSSVTCFGLAPSDFATIYNVQALWNQGITGSGQTIGIVSDSDINTADFTNFRSLFGLPAGTLNVIHPTTDPGNGGSTSNESEADVDTQWAGAVAPGATIDLVVSPTTNASFGGDLSAEYIIDNKSASIIGYSYGSCEFYLGVTGNSFYGGSPVAKDSVGEWSQAASEGITVVVSTGDNGSTSCDGPNNTPALGGPCVAPNQTPAPYDDPALCGAAVNGIASTPYNVAVGGTDFNDGSNPTTYWNTSNASTTNASVKGYIPETTYNDSCTNIVLDQLVDSSASTSAQTNCNNFFTAAPPTSTQGSVSELVVPFGGGGGVSTCTTVPDTATLPSQCTGGYPAPSWQTAKPASATNREVPDLSFFAGDGLIQNYYLYCEEDIDETATTPCNLTEVTSNPNNQFPNIQGVGGTSVSAEVFVGAMALLNQQLGSAQGLPNQMLYGLGAQPWANCTSSGTINSACIFYQVTSGTIAMPCGMGSVDCVISSSAVPPAVRPNRLSRWRTPGLVAFGSMLSIAILLISFRRRNRRWGFAAASLVFLAFLAVAGCGGGSSSGGGGSTAPSITTQPANQTVNVGQTATFSVTATGTAPLSYQWSKSGTNISGATSSSYTTPATTAADNASTFKVVVTNSVGSVTSNAATLTVNAVGAPSITTQPANQTVTVGQTATFSVTATGTAPLSYQWQSNSGSGFAAISGATSSSYTTPATTTANNGEQFEVVISNSLGNATSSAATLTVSSSSSANVGIIEVGGVPAYNAASGYNMATGLGSLNVYNLVTEWNVNLSGDFVLAATPAAVTTSGGNGTTTLTVTAVGSFTSTVNFTSSSCTFPSNVTGASCSFSQPAVTPGNQTTVTITVPTSPGAQPFPVIVNGTAGSVTRTTAIMVTAQ